MVQYYEGKNMLRRVEGPGAHDEVFERLAPALDAAG
jgi:hypothetical protein